ncbi:hypothetical protein EQG49_04360 [Periweissella cryptocerci]|uniref:Uncharacterized protein n=1 Tax=Periweissella cryptocerci TaxID=2506420 RepID=A0A4P6YSQ0_9LACO|nr:hypothetical protein [Periweissella cryptocerci]QBO35748.1 hypothetical protein EQG49_04360 [Periweissella cryptocerci]
MKFSEMVKRLDKHLRDKHFVIEEKSGIEIYVVTSQGEIDQETYYKLNDSDGYSVTLISRGSEMEIDKFDSLNEAELFLLINVVASALPFVDVYHSLLAKKHYSFFVQNKFKKAFSRAKVFSKNGEIPDTLFLKEIDGLYQIYFETVNRKQIRVNRDGDYTYGDALYSVYLVADSVYAAKFVEKYLPEVFSINVIENILVEYFLKKALPMPMTKEELEEFIND